MRQPIATAVPVTRECLSPRIIDLVPAGMDLDGAWVFATEREASRMLIGQGAWLLVNFSPEILRALGLVAVGWLCVQFAEKK